MNNGNQQTLYDIFDLEHNATGAQILARYRLLRDQLTAEGITYDDPQFATLNDAYRILSDTVKRAEYDEQLKADGLYHAVERVDERTALSDLFELDDDDGLLDDELLIEMVDIEADKPKNQPIRPKVTRTFDREEKIRELQAHQRLASLQARQEALDELSQYPEPAHLMDRKIDRKLHALGLVIMVVLLPAIAFINAMIESIHISNVLITSVILGIFMMMTFNIWLDRRRKKQIQERINIAKQQMDELMLSTTNNLLDSDGNREEDDGISDFYGEDENNQQQHSG